MIPAILLIMMITKQLAGWPFRRRKDMSEGHYYDNDGVCIYCGFDGAEHHHMVNHTYEGRSGAYDQVPLCGMVNEEYRKRTKEDYLANQVDDTHDHAAWLHDDDVEDWGFEFDQETVAVM